MRNEPRISILTPTRNRCRSFLPLAIASVRALRLSVPYEHVVVDDGSEDGTGLYLAAESAVDPRLVPVTHPSRRGVAAARNSAARLATSSPRTAWSSAAGICSHTQSSGRCMQMR